MGGGALGPLVPGRAPVPVVTDPAVALAQSALAVLSARAHGNDAEGLAVVQATVGGWMMEQRQLGTIRLQPFAQRIAAGGRTEGEAAALLRIGARRGLALTDAQQVHGMQFHLRGSGVHAQALPVHRPSSRNHTSGRWVFVRG